MKEAFTAKSLLVTFVAFDLVAPLLLLSIISDYRFSDLGFVLGLSHYILLSGQTYLDIAASVIQFSWHKYQLLSLKSSQILSKNSLKFIMAEYLNWNFIGFSFALRNFKQWNIKKLCVSSDSVYFRGGFTVIFSEILAKKFKRCPSYPVCILIPVCLFSFRKISSLYIY